LLRDNIARVLITGSTTGLGLLAAQKLLDDGHEVVLHARNSARAETLAEIAPHAAGVVVGDLASADETRRLANQVNRIGGINAVIHNEGIVGDPNRLDTPEGHARTLAVNLLAPYLLTAWIEGPPRLIYLSSSMHKDGDRSLRDIDWTERRWNGVQAYPRQQALRHSARPRGGASPSRSTFKCGRSGLGADKNGRTSRVRRPGAEVPHADMAGRQ
jgi:nucleoside-diphosphate-sugar epimerase